MSCKALDGHTFVQMIQTAARHLENNKEQIDALNVFPVPDGDTGTNMNLSMRLGAKEATVNEQAHIGQVANTFAKGLLMGARGNSGVILSQLFRGFAKSISEKDSIQTTDFAKALQAGSETAYKAVVEPVEGTILTVAREGAEYAIKKAETETEFIPFIKDVLHETKAALQRTPELLPILKEVGVVDSGGQGLVTIYEGFLAALNGEALPEYAVEEMNMEQIVHAEHHKIAQDHIDTDEIKYGYCTEFMVRFDHERTEKHPFNEEDFRTSLQERGDSLVVVSDEDVVKVHIHTEYPGEAMTFGQKFGDLINIKVENMREQHSKIMEQKNESTVKSGQKLPYAVISISMGEGISAMFKSLGSTYVLEGGQTMNPSAKDIKDAIDTLHAENIIVLPNNKNIIMAAEQAANLSDTNVTVIGTKTIPEGIAALLAFNPEKQIDANEKTMKDAVKHVQTGQITYAIRDSEINGLQIKKDQYIGIANGEIKVCEESESNAAYTLLKTMLTDDDEILTILYGEDVSSEEAEKLEKQVNEEYPDLEIELYEGKQPIYAYIFAIE